MSKKLSKMNTCVTSLKEVWECFIISKTSKCVSDAKLFFVIACASANMVSALFSNILVFQMRGIAFLLWMLVAGAAGLLAGLLGEQLFRRLIRVPENRDVMRNRIS